MGGGVGGGGRQVRLGFDEPTFCCPIADQLLTKPELNMVWTCNELNAGYAAGESGLKAWYSCL